MSNLETTLRGIVKEAVKESMAEYFKGNNLVVTKQFADATKQNGVVKGEETKETKKDRKAELKELSYNDLKALVKDLGGKAVGSKDAIIKQIMDLESVGKVTEDNSDNIDDTEDSDENEVEESEDGEEEEVDEEALRAEFKEFLKGIEDAEVKVIAKELKIVTKNKKISDIIEEELKDLGALEDALDILGFYDEDGEEAEGDDQEAEACEDMTQEELEEVLQGLSIKQLKDLAKKAGLKFKVKDTKATLVSILLEGDINLEEMLVEAGYVEVEENEDEDSDSNEEESGEDEEDEDNEEEPEEGDDDGESEDDEEVESLAEELGLTELSVEELADILAEYELSTKGKKQALIDRIVQGVQDGVIEFEDEEEEEDEESEDNLEDILNHDEMTLKDLKDIAKKLSIKTVGKKRKALIEAILKKDEEKVRTVLDQLFGEEDEEEDENGEDFAERTKIEDALEDKIRANYKSKKLKDAKVKAFVVEIESGESSNDDETSILRGKYTSKMTKDELLDTYIEAKRRLIDDEGESHEQEEAYIRNGVGHCCGRPLMKGDEGVMVCSACGEEYSE